MLVQVSSYSHELHNLLALTTFKASRDKTESLFKTYQENDGWCLYMTEDKKGVVGLVDQGNLLVIKHIGVGSDWQGKGLGRAMIRKLLTLYPGRGLEAETDDQALGFYQKLGFRVQALGEKYPGFPRYLCQLLPTKTVLMDLQGTLGGDPLGSILDFDFYPGVLEGLTRLKEADYRLVIVTNQSRIAAGDLTQADFDAKAEALITSLSEQGLDLELYVCPHSRYDGCTCKKPLRGMFDQAQAKMPIDIEGSFIVGDMGKSDMMFGHRIGLRKVLVLTGVGQGSLTDFRDTWSETEADYVAKDFTEASSWIVNSTKQVQYMSEGA